MLIIFAMYITKDNGKDNLTSGGAHRERTSWLEDSHLFANSYQDDHFFLHKHHQQCHPHSPLQQMKPWNQSLVALGRSAAPPCRLTSANLDFGFLNTCQQSQISPHNSSTKWDVDLSGVWPIVLGSGREAQVSSKARAGRWLDAVSCEELFSPQTKTRQRVSMMIGFFFTDGSTLPSSSRVRPGGQAQPSAHRLNRSITLSV